MPQGYRMRLVSWFVIPGLDPGICWQQHGGGT